MNRKLSVSANLECKLSDIDIAKLGKELATIHSEKNRIESRMKSYQSQCKADIAQCNATIQSISERVNTGKEFRDVECRIFYDFNSGTKEFIRVDTGEIVRTERISDAEIQEELDLRASHVVHEVSVVATDEATTEPTTETAIYTPTSPAV